MDFNGICNLSGVIIFRKTSILYPTANTIISEVMICLKHLNQILDAVMERDPAARSRAEVFFLYSGFKAVRSHRKANWFSDTILNLSRAGFLSGADTRPV